MRRCMAWRATIDFNVDDAEHAVRPGDTLFIKRGVVHGFHNVAAAARCLRP